jgi:uncharacterized protein (DUF2252 family)
MNIQTATKSYENWMRSCTSVIEADLRAKHEMMKEDLYFFFRGTFYRWIQLWPEVCSDLRRAPKVLASGDLHVDSFGTWRDAEGRLCWGIDDFDESYPLPYTNDLVRLATSLKIVIDCEALTIGLKDGCDAILDGYQKGLKDGGCPIVLAEHEEQMEKLGMNVMPQAGDFWGHLLDFPVITNSTPRDVRRILSDALPAQHLDFKVVRRIAGLGSRGQKHFVAIAKYRGAYTAREAKAMVPSACFWVAGEKANGQKYYEQIISSAVRSPDPFQKMSGTWLIRRLSPDSNPIEIAKLPQEREEEKMLFAMGIEAANIHLGTKRQVKNILKDLRARKSNWLRSSAKNMAKATTREWKDFKRS